MAWYDTGTVSVTNGSTAVTGSGTNFVAGAQVGEGFYGPDGRLYEIQAIISATSLTLADAYLGTTQTGQEYKIIPTQSLVADLASQVSTLISDYQSVADNAGEGKFQDGSATSPGITFTLDQDTGFFRDTANEIGVAVAGVKKAEFNSSGMQFEDNSKAIFGAGSDLQIYHTGAHSYIDDQGTGNLYLNSNGSGTIIQGGGTQARFFNGAGVDLWYNNAIKLATTSTGVDVTGTVTADVLDVDGIVTITDGNVRFDLMESDTTDLNGRLQNTGGVLQIRTLNDAKTSAKNRIVIDHSTGDISFYEDTGTTPKFFWDASAEALGIGTTSPSFELDVQGASDTCIRVRATGAGSGDDSLLRMQINNADASNYIQFGDNSDSDAGYIRYQHANDSLQIGVNATERMRIDSSGRVGIGTTSPSAPLDVVGSPGTLAEFRDGAAANFIVETSSNVTTIGNQAGSSQLAFKASNSEAMRLDASGNLLVATTNTSLFNDNTDDEGMSYKPSGALAVSRVNGTPAFFNRQNTDGDIIDFRKDGNSVGSIGVVSGNAFFAGTSLGMRPAATGVVPVNASGASADNAYDIGQAAVRWDDVYATNGTIQTSDANEKQDIDVLSDAEQRVAVAAKGLLRKFRWKDAVAEKGDDARIHFGIIAQDLQAAFAAEGLDAGKYAMFIHTTWTDEETGEERSRMGVRYSELLAFIIAAL